MSKRAFVSQTAPRSVGRGADGEELEQKGCTFSCNSAASAGPETAGLHRAEKGLHKSLGLIDKADSLTSLDVCNLSSLVW